MLSRWIWGLEITSLLNKKVLNFYHLKSLSFILWWVYPSLRKVNFSKYLDLYRRNASGTCKTCMQEPFPNGDNRIWKCYNKRIILKVNKSKHAQISCYISLLIHFFRMFRFYTPWKHHFPDVFRGYNWEYGGRNGLNNTPFL